MNQRARYLGQRSRTHTHAHQTSCTTWTTKVISKNRLKQKTNEHEKSMIG